MVLQSTKYKVGGFIDFVLCTLSCFVPCVGSKYKKSVFSDLSPPRILWCNVADYKLQKCWINLNIVVTIHSNMKRSGAPSNAAAVATKKQKTSMASQSSVASSKSQKSSTAMTLVSQPREKVPQLSAKQLKVFHYLITAVSYFSVLESNPMAGAKMRTRCYDFYHGFDIDHPGFLHHFLSGNGRFRIIWDDDRIISGLGYISGVSKASCSTVLKMSTLSARNFINGRQILNKAKEAVREAKKLLAFWMEFLINDKMPSGKNEEDALQYVIRRAREETSVELVDDEEDDADDGGNTQEENVKDDSDEEVEDAVIEEDDPTFKDEDKEDSQDTSDSEEDVKPCAKEKTAKKSTQPESTFLPPSLLLFILYGPYGVAAYGLEISAALSMNSEGIDEQAAAKKNMSQASMRKSERNDEDRRR